jgi:hypothetical protein
MSRHTTKHCELEKDEIRLEITLQITEQIHSIPTVFGHCNRSECTSSVGSRGWSQVSSLSPIPHVHCKEKSIYVLYSFSGNCPAPAPISTFMRL